MASSQVEIASSSSPTSPFGCILNRGSSRAGRGGGGGAAFQKNLKELVRDHLHTCISVNTSNDPGFDRHHHEHPDDNNTNFLNRNNAGGDEMTMMMSQKQVKLLDRWAARQAKEMVSELKPDDCQDSENLAASSLVQIWEARLQHPPTPRPASIPNPHQPTSSGFCCFSSSIESDKSLISSPLDSQCTTAMSSSVQSRRNSDAGGDSEKLRVADIIRRLACNGNDNVGQQPSVCHGGDSPVHRVERRPTTSLISPNCLDQADTALLRAPLPQLVVASPRMIRGRQAFNDLLVQLEKERHAEVQSLGQRHAVSKFPQRGRIQSMLRLRIMQRGMGMTVQDHIRPPSLPCTTPASGSTTQNHGSTISHLRERFTACIEQAKRAPNISTTSSAIPETAQSSTSAEVCEDKTNKESALADPSNTPQMFQDSFATRATELTDSFENPQTQESSADATVEIDATCQEGRSSRTIEKQPTQESSIDAPEDTDITHQEGISSYMESYGSQETSQTCGSNDGWYEDEIEREEEEEEQVSELDDDYEYTTDDWCSSISRPRSYWESIRQAWYNELLSTTSATDEIRKLLERRTVSSFLASNFRDRMDRLMVSRTKLQAVHRQEEMEDNQESMGHLMLSYFQRHTHATTDQAESEVETSTEQLRGLDQQQQQGGLESGDEEQGHQSIEPPSSYVNEASHQESESVSISTLPPPPLPPPPRWPEASQEDRQTSTSGNGHSNSTEMELITELRGQMEQLQREMVELRKSLQASMEMQLHQYHAYPNLNAHPPPPPPVRRDDMNLVEMSNKRRVCCICYEMPVDTFLYRCGHMCTCLKCAHELQWSSGKCPICRAPILDVVRAYLDS